MRWPWQKKPKVEPGPTHADFSLPEKDSTIACAKCGARPVTGFGFVSHDPWFEFFGPQGRCCFAAHGQFNGEKYYLAHLSRSCPRCLHSWPERPLDWVVSE